MSDAGDEIQVDAVAEVEVVNEAAPKGKLSVEDALQVRHLLFTPTTNPDWSFPLTASPEECTRS